MISPCQKSSDKVWQEASSLSFWNWSHRPYASWMKGTKDKIKYLWKAIHCRQIHTGVALNVTGHISRRTHIYEEQWLRPSSKTQRQWPPSFTPMHRETRNRHGKNEMFIAGRSDLLGFFSSTGSSSFSSSSSSSSGRSPASSSKMWENLFESSWEPPLVPFFPFFFFDETVEREKQSKWTGKTI